jgi:Gram-negative bacterial TonB protein C-terminal
MYENRANRRVYVAMISRACGLVAWLAFVPSATAQAPVRPDTSNCDSIVAAARVDSVPARLFVAVTRMDGPELSPARREKILSTLVSSFLPPAPFRLTVFAGGVQMRTLRAHDDDRADPRAPTVTGRYRVYASRGGDSLRFALVRASLMPGFDEAALDAIRSARGTGAFAPPPGADSMIVDVRFSSEASPGARQFVEANFPRMPVVDAVPALDNPAPEFPEDERAAGAIAGEVVFQLVIDRSGSPAMETIEVLRASSMSFVMAAVHALPKQRFAPATIHGCPVAQQIEYPMTFVLPAAAAESSREPAGAPRRGIDDDATAGP